MRVLVAGWFSFEYCHATAGDLMAKDIICRWLNGAQCPYEVAAVGPFGALDWRQTDASDYSHVVFVCGPFPYVENTLEFLDHFRKSRLIGIDLSMLNDLDQWNPFDILFERDSNFKVRPDLTYLSTQSKLPVVGLILVHPQHEYKERSCHAKANLAIKQLIETQKAVFVPIDTELDPNTTNLRNSAEVESMIARMDCVITTRMHGMVLALKNGVPALAVDAISGGAKVSYQAHAVDWHMCFIADKLDNHELEKAFHYCLTPAARLKTQTCKKKALAELSELQNEFLASLFEPNIKSSRLKAAPKPNTTLEKYEKLDPDKKVFLKKIKSIPKRLIRKTGRLLLRISQ
jgi:hypothetical protein